MQLQDLVREYWRPLAEAFVACGLLALNWAAQRTKRWLLEHLDREKLKLEEMLTRQRVDEMRRHKETLIILSKACAPAEPPTLESLLANERQDFSLESLPESFTPPTPMSRRSPIGGEPTRLRVERSPEPIDWSDDEEITTVPETPHSKGSPPNER